MRHGASYYGVLLPRTKTLASGNHGGPELYYLRKNAVQLNKDLKKHGIAGGKVVPVAVEWDDEIKD